MERIYLKKNGTRKVCIVCMESLYRKHTPQIWTHIENTKRLSFLAYVEMPWLKGIWNVWCTSLNNNHFGPFDFKEYRRGGWRGAACFRGINHVADFSEVKDDHRMKRPHFTRVASFNLDAGHIRVKNRWLLIFQPPPFQKYWIWQWYYNHATCS